MAQERYNVVFQGEIEDGHDVEEVKHHLCEVFKATSNSIDRLFSTPRVVIKKDVDYQMAMQYKSTLAKAGAVCHIEPLSDPASVGLSAHDQAPEAMPAETSSTMMTCPKCNTQQPRAEECSYCGIIISKYVERRDIREDILAPVPFLQHIPGAFSYPLQSDGLTILIGGAIFFWVLSFFGLLVGIFTSGYISAYMMKIIASSANGAEKLPDWPDFSTMWDDILRPYLLMLAIGIVSALPALVYMYNVATAPNHALLGLLILVGGLYAPMGLLAVSMFHSLAALNPLLIVPSIMKIPGDYIVACLLLLLASALSLIDIGARLPIPIMGSLLGKCLSFYLLMVAMRILGLLYYTNEARLGWFAL